MFIVLKEIYLVYNYAKYILLFHFIFPGEKFSKVIPMFRGIS